MILDKKFWLTAFATAVLAACGETGSTDAGTKTDGGKTDSGVNDAGTDAGMNDAGTDAGMTDAGVACSTSNAQPDTCGYGGACFTDMKCGEAQNDSSCVNIAQAITKGNHSAWSRLTSTGPVIYVHVDEADVAADCTGTAAAFTVTVYAYAGTSLFPASSSGLPGFWYFDATGTKTDIPTALLRPSNYTVSADKKNMNAKFTLCAAAGTTSLQAGFAFTGGNGYCANLTR